MPFTREYFEELAQEYAHAYSNRHVRTSFHVAFVYGRRDILLASSTNKIGTRSSGAGFSRMSIHAERAALKAVGDVSLLRDATLVVIRINSKGELANSKPCEECEKHLNAAIKKYGLRRVLYS
jgi:hypothetical protein